MKLPATKLLSMKNIAVTLVLALFAGLGVVNAQDMKIGFVQSDLVLSLMPEAKVAQQDIAAFERKLNNRLTAMRQGLELQAAQLKQIAPTLPDSVRAGREQELGALQQDIVQEQRTAQNQLQFKIMQVMNPLEQKVQVTIDSVAQLNGYTHIFPTDISGQTLLIYSHNPAESNVTPLVIEALGLAVPADTVSQ